MFSLAFWDGVEYISVAVIILGVIGEYVADFTLPEKTENDKRRQKRLGKISTLVLILGLTVELPAIWRINEMTGTQVADLERQADVARAQAKGFESSIASANERAANAGAQVANASRQAAAAGVKAAEASERARALELETAKQREKAAIAEKELLTLKEGLKPRALSAAQFSLLVERLKSSPNKGVVGVMSVGDSEAIAFAKQLFEALQAAGWQPNVGEGSGVFLSMPPEGLTLNVHSPATAPVYAGDLQKALLAAGVSVPAVAVPLLHEDSVLIVVGAKPKPKQ